MRGRNAGRENGWFFNARRIDFIIRQLPVISRKRFQHAAGNNGRRYSGSQYFRAENLRGDILLYKDGEGNVVVHRLIVNPGRGAMILTKGDSMSSPDEPVSAERILGRIVAIKRDGRKINLESFLFRAVNALRFHPLFRKLCRFKRSRKNS